MYRALAVCTVLQVPVAQLMAVRLRFVQTMPIADVAFALKGGVVVRFLVSGRRCCSLIAGTVPTHPTGTKQAASGLVRHPQPLVEGPGGCTAGATLSKCH